MDKTQIKVGELNISFNKIERSISAHFPIVGGNAVLKSKYSSNGLWRVSLNIEDKEKFFFKVKKTLANIGNNRRSEYYKLLYDNLDKTGIIPGYNKTDSKGKISFKENFEALALDLGNANGEIEEKISGFEWNNSSEKNLKAWTTFEKFTKTNEDKAKKILEECKLIDEVLDVAELKVVMQRDRTALTFLIALSSFLENPIHLIMTGPPGIGKSAISEIVFDLFPAQCKETIGKESTPASLYNMTRFAERSKVLSNKLIQIGDLGNHDEIENARDLLSIFKVLMSEGKYSKNISIKEDDGGHIAQKLTLEDIGSVQLSTIEENIDSQFDSRAIKSSPRDTSKIRKAIRDLQVEDLEFLWRCEEFDERRPVIARAILELAMRVQHIRRKSTKLNIINPYAAHMEKFFNIERSQNANRLRVSIRDFPKSVTLANIAQRTSYYHPQTGKFIFIMTPEDYLYALKIVGKPILQMLEGSSVQEESYIRFIGENILSSSEWEHKDLWKYSDFEKEKLTDEGWLDLAKKHPSFIKKQMESIGASYGSVSTVLNNFVEKKLLFKVQIASERNKNIYFPTSNLLRRVEKSGEDFIQEKEEAEILSIARKKYDENIEKLEKYGYRKYGPTGNVFN